MKTRNNKAKTTVKIINFDLANGTCDIMVGLNLRTITVEDRMILKAYERDWNSGLKRISGKVYEFDESAAMYEDGRAKAGMIRRILGL